MMIDSEIGMPLDLNAFDGIWSDDAALNRGLNPPPPSTAGRMGKPVLDPEDQALLEAPARSTIINGVVSASNFVQAGSLTQTYHKPEVAWLRNTTYLSRDIGKKGVSSAGMSTAARPGERKAAEALVVDDSMMAQQQAIEKTFWFHDHTNVEDLRHPLKAHLRAVDVSPRPVCVKRCVVLIER
jgi:RNA polymerase II-associated factor 1